MITQKDIADILHSYGPLYNLKDITIGVLGGHSGLDVCLGAKKAGFRTLAVCQEGREKTYTKYFKTREAIDRPGITLGCIDEILMVKKFTDIIKPEVQEELRKLKTIFIHNRYFWVYCDFEKIEKEFRVPIFGTRNLLKLEERDQPKNQYYLLEKAGIRIPKMFKKPEGIDRLVLVKVNEVTRRYERAFFTASNFEEYQKKTEALLKKKLITEEGLKKATIEEFIIGAPVNFNFFYSPFAREVELLGTDTRRQTNLDGLLRLPSWKQNELYGSGFEPKMIETGHIAVTVKESLLEKIFDLGERFAKITQQEHPPGIIGPFALQGAVVAEEGKEDIVIFDVSLRIPGSPGTRFTPYSSYLYGQDISVGERIAMEIAEGIKQGKLEKILT